MNINEINETKRQLMEMIWEVDESFEKVDSLKLVNLLTKTYDLLEIIEKDIYGQNIS